MNTVTLSNGVLTVKISTLGAELKSLIKNGVEYLWQGDSNFWSGQAPTLFPIVGRLRDGKYLHKGNPYELACHGFARKMVYTVENQTENSVTFTLKDNEETKKVYPFNFLFKVAYTLNGDKVRVDYTVENPAKETLYFGLGGHPGFNMPIDKGTFDDWYLEFNKTSSPKEFVCSDRSLFYPDLAPYTLKDGTKIAMTRKEWDNSSGVYLDGAPDTVTLKSDISSLSVTVKSDMRFMCFWSAPESSFMCIEPWESAPDTELDKPAGEIAEKAYMTALKQGEIFTKYYEIIIK